LRGQGLIWLRGPYRCNKLSACFGKLQKLRAGPQVYLVATMFAISFLAALKQHHAFGESLRFYERPGIYWGHTRSRPDVPRETL